MAILTLVFCVWRHTSAKHASTTNQHNTPEVGPLRTSHKGHDYYATTNQCFRFHAPTHTHTFAGSYWYFTMPRNDYWLQHTATVGQHCGIFSWGLLNIISQCWQTFMMCEGTMLRFVEDCFNIFYRCDHFGMVKGYPWLWKNLCIYVIFEII